MISAITASISLLQTDRSSIYIPPPESRFALLAPIATLPPVLLDKTGDYVGIAQTTAQSKGLQARILWIDGTANIPRINSEEKIVALVKQIKTAGFNTIVFDVKPIVGYTLYPSRYAPKLTEWKGEKLPSDFDPLKVMAREAKANAIPLIVSFNAFSEGHRLTKQGLGYENLEWQTVLYEPVPFLRCAAGRYKLEPIPNQLPANDLTIGVFTSRSAVPKSGAMFGVVVGANGLVISSLDADSLAKDTPAIPAGGSLMLGYGRAADYLRQNVHVGITVGIDSDVSWVPISQRSEEQIPLMVNPNNLEVQKRLLDMVREVLTNYDLAGLVFDDRLRYGGMNADFSYRSQALFERYIGKSITWPDDVFKYKLTPSLQKGIVVGPYFDAWMVWRAMVLRNWVAQVRNVIKEVRADALFGVYAGSSFGTYQKYGANWADSKFDAGFWFLTKEYKQTGFGGLLDFFIPGCYYPTATIADALAAAEPVGNTIEAAGQLCNRAARDQAWCYAGIMLSQFADRPEELKRALQAACASTQGVMVFDLSHDMQKFWPIFQDAFRTPVQAPHAVNGLLEKVRRMRLDRDKKGLVDPPTIINSGLPGTGM